MRDIFDCSDAHEAARNEQRGPFNPTPEEAEMEAPKELAHAFSYIRKLPTDNRGHTDIGRYELQRNIIYRMHEVFNLLNYGWPDGVEAAFAAAERPTEGVLLQTEGEKANDE